MAKVIGPNFDLELAEAGLLGLPFSWGEDGVFGMDKLPADKKAALQAVLDAHDPEKPRPPSKEDKLKADAGRAELLALLQTATPKEIDDWVAKNASTALSSLIKLIATQLPPE